MAKRLLPANVSAFRDRHGKTRYRYRKAGQPTRYFKGELGSPEFLAELREFQQAAGAAEPRREIVRGTVDDLLARYYRSQDFNDQGEVSRAKNRAVLEGFRDGRGERRVAAVTFEHIDAILAKKAKKGTNAAGRPIGGKAAAQRLRKQLRRLFAYAVKIGMRADNPVELTAQVKYKTKGWHDWTEEEIAQFRARHPLGTKPRLALEIMLWTGQRRGDVRTFGRGHIRGGKICYTQQKGGKELWLPVVPQLQRAIDAMPSVGIKTFLVTEAGEPFTHAGFGNWFRDRCDEAGLPQCSAHGLRKACARRMADIGAGNQGIKAVGGWTNDREVATYTAGADQRRLAEQTLTAVSAWEMGVDASAEGTKIG